MIFISGSRGLSTSNYLSVIGCIGKLGDDAIVVHIIAQKLVYKMLNVETWLATAVWYENDVRVFFIGINWQLINIK